MSDKKPEQERGTVQAPVRLLSCLWCGETPEITGMYSENKKAAFCTLRILHCCRESHVWVDLQPHAYIPGLLTEAVLRHRLGTTWNRMQQPNSELNRAGGTTVPR